MEHRIRKLDRGDLLREAYPNLSEEERAQSHATLRRFLDLCLRMHEREEREQTDDKRSTSD